MSVNKQIDGGMVYDPNNDYYNPDVNLNTGQQKAVVMVGGVAKVVSSNNAGEPDLTLAEEIKSLTETEEEKSARETKEAEKELKEVDLMLEQNRNVKVTQLPDDVMIEETVIVDKKSSKGPLKERKPISRIKE